MAALIVGGNYFVDLFGEVVGFVDAGRCKTLGGTMRLFAIISNILFLVGVSCFLVNEADSFSGVPVLDWVLLSLIILYPIINLMALSRNKKGQKGLISLYFTRKTMEEKKKIEELKKD